MFCDEALAGPSDQLPFGSQRELLESVLQVHSRQATDQLEPISTHCSTWTMFMVGSLSHDVSTGCILKHLQQRLPIGRRRIVCTVCARTGLQ